MKNKVISLLLFLCFSSAVSYGQKTLAEVLKKYNTESIPYITVNKLKNVDASIILLDAREKNEYNVSHLKNAMFVGYEKFNIKKTIKRLPNKDAKIVVYCSLGVRSEDIAEQLKMQGYTKVYNLYGGIFEWKNKGNSVFAEGLKTNKIHAYSKEWGKWLLKGEKVYE